MATTKSQKESKAAPTQARTNVPDMYWVLFGIGLLVIFWLRYRLVPIPFERDEGEYAYMGTLLLDGLMPYKDAYNMKLPGTYFMYAFFMVLFGKSVWGVHVGLLLMTLGTSTLLFVSFRKMYSPLVALLTSIGYGILSLSMNNLGFAGHATHFVLFFAALSIFLMEKYTLQHRLHWILLAGVAMGLSFLMKQQAVFLLVMGGLWVLWMAYEGTDKNLVKTLVAATVYSLGVFVPYVLVLLLMWSTGSFDKFWFWTVQYASKYAAGATWEEGKMLFSMSFKPMWDEYSFLYVLSFVGIPLVFWSQYSWRSRAMALVFFAFTFLTVCPGFYFRQHYFIPWLPAVALMASISLDVVLTRFAQFIKMKSLAWAAIVVFAFIFVQALQKNKIYYFKTKPEVLCKMIYGTNPFVESLPIAEYIKNHTDPGQKIAILGSEPQILVYADRKSATGHIYTYGMMEIHDYNTTLQQEMIDQIEKEKPAYIVYANVRTSWLPRPGSVMQIFDWYGQYVRENYEVVGLADMIGNQTVYKFDGELAGYQQQGQEYVLIYRKKS